MTKPILEPLDFLLLRVPRLPCELADTLNSKGSIADTVSFLRKLYHSKEMQDAIFLASPAVYNQLSAQLLDSDHMPTLRLTKTLYKYAIRMATRCTPYGKFAAVASGTITTSPTSFILTDDWHSSLRIDMSLASILSTEAIAQPAVSLLYNLQRNNSVLKTHAHYRYIRYETDNGKRTYFRAQVKRTPLLDSMLSFTKKLQPYADVLVFLQHKELDVDQATAYIQKLIKHQLLYADTEASLCGSPPLHMLLKQQTKPEFRLACKSNLLQTIDAITAVSQQDNILAVDYASHIPLATDSPITGNIVQADTHASTSTNNLSQQTARQIANDLSDLLPLSDAVTASDLKDFCKRFINRYDRQEVPLLTVLDGAHGIGYGTVRSSIPLLDDIREDDGNYIQQEELKRLRLRSLCFSSSKRAENPVELTAEDIRVLSGDSAFSEQELPTTCYAIGSLLEKKTNRMAHGDFQFLLQAAGGVSAIPLLTRFSHIDHTLEHKLRECVAMESLASPDVLFAEIVFHPDDHIANVMLRPALHTHEIRITGVDSPSEQQGIPLSDIWVSVKDDKVVLRSKKLRKHIIPRSSCAHNYSRGNDLYRFLCDVQNQYNSLSIGWDWKELHQETFLPRVTYKHIILSRARWYIRTADCKQLLTTEHELAIATLRGQYKLPSRFLLCDGDNELLIDTRHPLACMILLERIQKGDVFLHEELMDAASPVQSIKNEYYSNQLIIPFRTKGYIKVPEQQHPISNKKEERVFPPGSEWLYVKIYMAASLTDKLLCEVISKLITNLEEKDLIQNWFFIRFSDPEPHLRLRLSVDPGQCEQYLPVIMREIHALLSIAMHKKTVVKIQYDTYERELERYASIGIVTAEKVFHIDSVTTVGLLQHFTNTGQDGQLHWLTAMLAIDDLLDIVSFKTKDKLHWAMQVRDSFMTEFGFGKQAKVILDSKFRSHKGIIEQYMAMKQEAVDPEIRELLVWRKKQLCQYFAGHSCSSETLASLIHMFINRHFHTQQRKFELLIYHFLSKWYRINLSRNTDIPYP